MATENNIGDLWVSKHQRIRNELVTDLKEPGNYNCDVVAYTYHHHQLLIEVIEPNAKEYKPRCYIALDAVFYFEGPLNWQGADFRFGSLDERKALLREGWCNVEHVSEMAEHFAPLLLILERPTFRVRILAGACYVTETRPFEIHQVFPNPSQ